MNSSITDKKVSPSKYNIHHMIYSIIGMESSTLILSTTLQNIEQYDFDSNRGIFIKNPNSLIVFKTVMGNQ